MSDFKAKADQYVAQANKKLRSFGFFGNKYEEVSQPGGWEAGGAHRVQQQAGAGAGWRATSAAPPQRTLPLLLAGGGPL